MSHADINFDHSSPERLGVLLVNTRHPRGTDAGGGAPLPQGVPVGPARRRGTTAAVVAHPQRRDPQTSARGAPAPLTAPSGPRTARPCSSTPGAAGRIAGRPGRTPAGPRERRARCGTASRRSPSALRECATRVRARCWCCRCTRSTRDDDGIGIRRRDAPSCNGGAGCPSCASSTTTTTSPTTSPPSPSRSAASRDSTASGPVADVLPRLPSALSAGARPITAKCQKTGGCSPRPSAWSTRNGAVASSPRRPRGMAATLHRTRP